MKKGYIVTLIIFLVLLIDQGLKYYVKTNFCYNEDVAMFGADWARLHFVENEGMAFGITFDWAYGKLVLSLFRILMVAGLVWYIRLLIAARAPSGFIYSVGFITAGALGNIIDSAIYGLMFSASPMHDCIPATVTAFGEGYGTFLHGKVVDMLYFPITWVHMPSWVPSLGGNDYLFFSPIFNIADASITTGVLFILLFQRRFFSEGFSKEEENSINAPDHLEAEEIETLPADQNTEETTATAEHSGESIPTDAAEIPGSSDKPEEPA